MNKITLTYYYLNLNKVKFTPKLYYNYNSLLKNAESYKSPY